MGNSHLTQPRVLCPLMTSLLVFLIVCGLEPFPQALYQEEGPKVKISHRAIRFSCAGQ